MLEEAYNIILTILIISLSYHNFNFEIKPILGIIFNSPENCIKFN
jgi:hypothetical protein